MEPDWDTHAHCSEQIPYNLNEYLTPATWDFCDQAISDIGYDPSTLTALDVKYNGSPQYNRIYSTLRDHIYQHILRTQNTNPILKIPENPRGAHR